MNPMKDDTQRILGEILEALKSMDARLARIETGGQLQHKENEDVPAHAVSQRKKSIKEFLIERAPADDVQKTLAIGYFKETNEGMTSFNKSDLEKGYREAKDPPPSNINDKVNMSIKNGHMMEAEKKKDNMKAWVVTGTGEQYLLNGFRKESSRK